MGLPYSSVRRWAVCIDSAVGEPFLSTWKDYLEELVRQHQAQPATEAAEAVWRSRKRPREGLAPSPKESPHCASEGRNVSSSSRSEPEQLFFVLNGDQSSSPAWGCLWVLGAPCQVPSPCRRFFHGP